MTRKQVRLMKKFAVEVKKLEKLNGSKLTKAFQNVLRVEENHCTFPLDMTESEKNDLRILGQAILKSQFTGNAYDVLRDAFTRERNLGRGGKKSVEF
jgi:hypothetical protein